ncbi:hypothetical protein RND59_02505 [Vibrio ruber]|uniref:hypothetical protein n=1 Tax=Vibrio ruber TaxID=184755 RepID=UPI0028933653|nr:hypothetical protein [Vibrio ruber]WNJ96006.1 hypothetical protein RND59_02505 [Vibrio ruber]
MSKPIVFIVDADIARSSGLSEHPVSSGSRSLLENIQKHGHMIAMCPTLRTEWKKHRSYFALKWLSSMFAKKRVKLISPSENIEEKIKLHISEEKNKSIALKDAHLINAALCTDRIVASNDDNARNTFYILSMEYGYIKNIIWLNSVRDREFIYDFLSSRCLVPSEYYLSSQV